MISSQLAKICHDMTLLFFHIQTCSIGLRYGDWRPSEFSELHIKIELTRTLWCVVLLEVASQDEYNGLKNYQQQYSRILQHLNNPELVAQGRIECLHSLHQHKSEPLIQGRLGPCFLACYAKSWAYFLNVEAEIETCQIRQSSLHTTIVQLWKVHTNCSFSFLFLSWSAYEWCALPLIGTSWSISCF